MNILSIAIQNDEFVSAIRVRFDAALDPLQEASAGQGWTIRIDGVANGSHTTVFEDTHTVYFGWASTNVFPPGAVVTIAYATPPGVLTGLAAFSARVIPRGPITEPLAAVETLMSRSAAFQHWTGSADATEALAKIHVIGLPSPAADRPSYTAAELAALRPMAVLNYDVAEPFAYEGIAQGQYTPNGRILIALEDDVATADARDFKVAAYKFLNVVGQIVEEMSEASEGGGFPVVQRVRMRMQPRRAEEKERPARGDYLVTIIGVEFGLADG